MARPQAFGLLLQLGTYSAGEIYYNGRDISSQIENLTVEPQQDGATMVTAALKGGTSVYGKLSVKVEIDAS